MKFFKYNILLVLALLLITISSAHATPNYAGVYENLTNPSEGNVTVTQSGKQIIGTNSHTNSDSFPGSYSWTASSSSTFTGLIDDVTGAYLGDYRQVITYTTTYDPSYEDPELAGTTQIETFVYTGQVSGTALLNEETTVTYINIVDQDGNPVFFAPETLRRVKITDTAGSAEIVGETIIQSSVKNITNMISSRISSQIKPISLARADLLKKDKYGNNSFDVANALNIESSFSSMKFNEAEANAQFTSGNIGLSAGDSSGTRGFWANIASTDIEDKDTFSEADTQVYSFIFGYDQKLNASTLVGISLTYEDVDSDTIYNSGKLDSDGFTIAPYISYNISDSMAIYAVAGYAFVDYDLKQGNNTARADLDADRYFAEINFMAFQSFDKVILNERVGYLHTHESQDSYTEDYYDAAGNYLTSAKISSNSITFSQLKANLEVSYAGEQLEPYIDVGYYYDVEQEKIKGNKNDRTGMDVTLGMRVFLSDNLTGEVTASQVFNRSRINETTFTGNIRYQF
jgi:hypothetical protein